MRIDVHPDLIREAFEEVKDSPVFADSKRLFDAGQLPVEMIQAMALRPPLLKFLEASCDAIYPGGIVEREVKELIMIEAARKNQCQFCRESHIVIAQMLGVSQDPLKLLDSPGLMSPRQRLAVEYTRAALTDSNKVSAALFTALRTVYSDEEIVEVTAMIGLVNMLTIFNNCLHVTYLGEYGE